MDEKYYLDMEAFNGIGVFASDYNGQAIQIIPAGSTINSMCVRDKNELYQKLSDDYDIKFIFDDTLPELDFYSVPQVDIFATDSIGGYWGTVGGTTDIENEKNPVCYINSKRKVFHVSENLKSFIYPMQSIGDRIRDMTPMDDVAFYPSKQDAEMVITFIHLPESPE